MLPENNMRYSFMDPKTMLRNDLRCFRQERSGRGHWCCIDVVAALSGVRQLEFSISDVECWRRRVLRSCNQSCGPELDRRDPVAGQSPENVLGPDLLG